MPAKALEFRVEQIVISALPEHMEVKSQTTGRRGSGNVKQRQWQWLKQPNCFQR